MSKIRLGKTNTFFPIPAALIAAGSGEKANAAAVAWIGMVSSTPPSVGVSLHKSRHTAQLIDVGGEFTVNIPPSSAFKETDYCGIVSGRKTNKIADIGFTFVQSKNIGAPIINECCYNMECKVVQKVELGDYLLFIGQILETYVDRDKFDEESSKIDIKKIDPLVYCAVIREYWSIGEKLGDAFSVGKELKY